MVNFKQFLELKDAKDAVRTQQKIYNRIVDWLEENDQLIGAQLNLVGNDDQDCFRFAIACPHFLDFNDEAAHEIQFHPVFNPTIGGRMTVDVKLVIICKEDEHTSETYTENMLMSFTAHQMDLLQKSWAWLNTQYQERFKSDLVVLVRKSV
jgi:hypothetical protein